MMQKKIKSSIIKSILFISLLAFNTYHSFSQETSLNSCDTNNILNLVERAYNLKYSNNDSSIYYANLGIQLSQKSYYLKGFLKNLNVLSIAYFVKGDIVTSEKICRKTLKYAKLTNFELIEAMSYNNLANIYITKDDKTTALNYYLDGLKILEKINYEEGIKISLLNIGLIYKSLNLRQYAKDYLLRSISVMNPKTDNDQVASFLLNFAVILKEEGDIRKSEELSLLSLNYWHKSNSSMGIAWALINLGELQIILNEKEKGYDYFNKALYYANKSNNNFIISTSQLALGTYLYNHKQAEAFSHLSEAFRLAKMNNDFSNIYKSSLLLSSINFDKNKPKEAYLFLREAKNNQDSLLKSEEKITVQNLQIRNDYDKSKEKLIITQLDNERNKLFRNIFIGGSLLLVILLFSLSFLYKKVLKQKKELQAVNATKDKLFSIISHELRSPFHILRGYLWMISNKAITLEQFQTTSSALTKEVDYIFLALENLLNWAKAQMNGIVVKPVTINAYELIADILKVYTELAKEKSINLINNVPTTLEFYCDRHHADLIIRNTLNNAVKFSNTNSDIIIHSIVNKTNVQIIIQDQGVGISKDKINMLFSIEKHFSETGTKGEKGTGLGLLLCKEFIEKNGGSIQIESETNKGAKVILNFILDS